MTLGVLSLGDVVQAPAGGVAPGLRAMTQPMTAGRFTAPMCRMCC